MAYDGPDAGQQGRPGRRRGAPLARRVFASRWLVLHAGAYVVVNGLLVAIWWLSERSRSIGSEFWPGWLMLLLGIPLALHAAAVFAARPTKDAAIRRPRADRTLATVLFTDIVSSTERARELGDRRWGQLLDAHDRLAHELVGRFGGELVKSTGDGVLAVFDTPGRGIRCATALQERLRAVGIEIRAGLHTGEVQRRGADVGGIGVHIAARVMAAAGGGEVLVSRTVRDLVAGSDIALDDQGAHALKGMAGEWELFAVRS
jgi:class 3 adenylate cyclase